MKLNPSQIGKIAEVVAEMGPSTYNRIVAICSEYAAMIAASDTHQIVEAPEGYKFTGKQDFIHDIRYDSHRRLALYLRPIPAPCPPPKLEPVPINVESVYGKMPEIPEAYKDWQVEFGEARKLLDQGFTHCLYLGFSDSVGALNQAGSGIYRICLRKWEGK